MVANYANEMVNTGVRLRL